MIRVEMTQDEIVDSGDPGRLRRIGNSFRVAIADFPPGVVQERLARRRHDECGRAALDVDPVDFEICRRGGLSDRANSRESESADDQTACGLHGSSRTCAGFCLVILASCASVKPRVRNASMKAPKPSGGSALPFCPRSDDRMQNSGPIFLIASA